MYRKKIQKNKGFTLIELMVAMGLFAFTAVAAITAMLSMLGANQKIISSVQSMDGLSFALESMTRELRVGRSYDCAGAITKGDTGDCNSGIHMGFVTSEGDFMEYRFNSGAIERRVEGGSWIPMTGDDLTIDDLDFRVLGSPPASTGDTEQPKVVLTIRGTALNTRGNDTTFSIQTTITQRFPDF